MNTTKTFCPSCRKNVTYTLKQTIITKLFENKNHGFQITTAICDNCGAEIGLPGLIDINIEEINNQYYK